MNIKLAFVLFIAFTLATFVVSANENQLKHHKVTSLLELSTKPIEANSPNLVTALATTSNFNCTPGPSSPECDYHGTCTNDGTRCICNDQYTTFKAPDGIQCNYHQVNTLGGFLMALFLGAEGGGGYFWIGQTGLGVGQLLYFWLGLCVVAALVVACKEIGAVIACGWGIGIFIWWLVAMIMIATGKINDGNGGPIAPL